VVSTGVQEFARASSSSASPASAWEEIRFLEGLCVLSWSYKASADDVVPNEVAVPPVAGDHIDGAPWGTLTYTIDMLCHLATPREVALDVDLTCPFTTVAFEEKYGEEPLFGQAGVVSDKLLERELMFDSVWLLPQAEADSLGELELPATYRVVSLGRRVDRSRFVLNMPPQASVAYWRKKAGQTRPPAPAPVGEVPQSAGVRAMLDLPRKRPPDDGFVRVVPPQLRARNVELDPLRLLNAVAVTTHLKQTEDLSEAMQDFKMYECDDFTGEVQRDTSRDPRKSSNFRNQRRVDLVGMLVQRRQWHKEVLDDEVSAIIAYSDSSPVVGMEIQGMQCDVCRKDQSIRSVIMPGSNVYYGIQDAISNMMI